jgi:hypothetical protein
MRNVRGGLARASFSLSQIYGLEGGVATASRTKRFAP